MSEHCCEMMQANAESVCHLHPNRFDCPDALVNYDEAERDFGLIIHDGGSSTIAIAFCPWCGTKLRT